MIIKNKNYLHSTDFYYFLQIYDGTVILIVYTSNETDRAACLCLARSQVVSELQLEVPA